MGDIRVTQRKWVGFQTKQAATGKVTVRSGEVLPTFMAFRCLYCGEYFNQSGAEEHFGKKREDYLNEREGKDFYSVPVDIDTHILHHKKLRNK